MTLSHLLAVVGLGATCAAWVLFQRWAHRRDPDSRGVEDGGGCCGGGACGQSCAPEPRPTDRGVVGE